MGRRRVVFIETSNGRKQDAGIWEGKVRAGYRFRSHAGGGDRAGAAPDPGVTHRQPGVHQAGQESARGRTAAAGRIFPDLVEHRSPRRDWQVPDNGAVPTTVHVVFLGCGFITGVHSGHLRRLGDEVVPSYASRGRGQGGGVPGTARGTPELRRLSRRHRRSGRRRRSGCGAAAVSSRPDAPGAGRREACTGGEAGVPADGRLRAGPRGARPRGPGRAGGRERPLQAAGRLPAPAVGGRRDRRADPGPLHDAGAQVQGSRRLAERRVDGRRRRVLRGGDSLAAHRQQPRTGNRVHSRLPAAAGADRSGRARQDDAGGIPLRQRRGRVAPLLAPRCRRCCAAYACRSCSAATASSPSSRTGGSCWCAGGGRRGRKSCSPVSATSAATRRCTGTSPGRSAPATLPGDEPGGGDGGSAPDGTDLRYRRRLTANLMPQRLRHRHHRQRSPAAAPWRRRWRPPVRASCSSSAADSCRASPRTGIPRRSGSTCGTARRRPGSTATAGRSCRIRTTASAATRSSGAASCTGCERRTSRRWRTSTACLRHGPSTTRRWSRTTSGPSGSTRCTARRGTTLPSRRAGRIRTRRFHTRPRSPRRWTELRAQGLHPSPLPLGLIDPGAPDGCILCNTCNSFPCRRHAKSEAEVCCVRPATGEENVTLWTRAFARRLLTGAGRPARSTAVEVERDGETAAGRGAARRGRLRGRQLRRAAVAVRRRRASGRAGELVGAGRPPLHGAPGDHDAGVPSLPGEPRGVPEDGGDQRLLLRRSSDPLPARPDPVAGPDARRDGADRRLVGSRRGVRCLDGPRQRLARSVRGPSAPGQPRHRRGGRPHPARVPSQQRPARIGAWCGRCGGYCAGWGTGWS